MENKISSKTIEVHTRPYSGKAISKIDASKMSQWEIRNLVCDLYKAFPHESYTVILIEK